MWALRWRWLVFAKGEAGKVDAETMFDREYVMNPADQDGLYRLQEVDCPEHSVEAKSLAMRVETVILSLSSF